MPGAPTAPQAASSVRVAVRRGRGRRASCTSARGTACLFAGSLKVRDAFWRARWAGRAGRHVEVRTIGCHGLCSQGPLAVVVRPASTYLPAAEDQGRGPSRRQEHLAGGDVVEELPYMDPATGERMACAHDIPFYTAQTRIALRDVGVIDPERHRRVHGARRLRGPAQGPQRR